jgi:hypothetical protein
VDSAAVITSLVLCQFFYQQNPVLSGLRSCKYHDVEMPIIST